MVSKGISSIFGSLTVVFVNSNIGGGFWSSMSCSNVKAVVASHF